jgi:hypothetical protein
MYWTRHAVTEMYLFIEKPKIVSRSFSRAHSIRLLLKSSLHICLIFLSSNNKVIHPTLCK